MKRICLLILLLAIVVSPGFGQRGRRGSRQQPSPGKQSEEEPLATISGTVKAIDSKMLITEDVEGNSLQYRSTKKTGYFDGDKNIKPDDIHAGDRVSVDARREPDGSLTAVNVRLVRLKK